MPIIFITAFPEERIRRRAEDAGAVGFFSKPVDSHALIECLDAALKRGLSRPELQSRRSRR
jgi:FixJ family two-component response regulator